MIDWDAAVLGPVMAMFGEGEARAPTFRPKVGAPIELPDAVFDAQYGVVAVDPQTGAETTTRMPALGVRAARFPAPPKRDDQVDIPSAGARYVVTNVQPDSHGHLVLILSRREPL